MICEQKKRWGLKIFRPLSQKICGRGRKQNLAACKIFCGLPNDYRSCLSGEKLCFCVSGKSFLIS